MSASDEKTTFTPKSRNSPEVDQFLLVGGGQGMTQAVGLCHLSSPLASQGKGELFQVNLGLGVKPQTLRKKIKSPFNHHNIQDYFIISSEKLNYYNKTYPDDHLCRPAGTAHAQLKWQRITQ